MILIDEKYSKINTFSILYQRETVSRLTSILYQVGTVSKSPDRIGISLHSGSFPLTATEKGKPTWNSKQISMNPSRTGIGYFVNTVSLTTTIREYKSRRMRDGTENKQIRKRGD